MQMEFWKCEQAKWGISANGDDFGSNSLKQIRQLGRDDWVGTSIYFYVFFWNLDYLLEEFFFWLKIWLFDGIFG